MLETMFRGHLLSEHKASGKSSQSFMVMSGRLKSVREASRHRNSRKSTGEWPRLENEFPSPLHATRPLPNKVPQPRREGQRGNPRKSNR